MEARNPQSSTMAGMGLGKDFLAVFDVASNDSTYGKLVAMRPAGGARMAHHTNYVLPANDVLYANDWMADRTYVFDLHDPANPRLVRTFGDAGKYGYPHSFVYLANGNTLATFQYTGGFNRAPGGLVEFDVRGDVVKSSSAANDRLDRNIRPYSIAVVEKLDRVVTSSADMMGAQESRVAQVWRLSDLKLIKTIVLPKPSDWYYDDPQDTSEPRVLADGKTVIVPTFGCGLYLMQNLTGSDPTLRHVYDLGYRTCEVPIVVGDYLVVAAQSGHAIVSLDVHEPTHPREVSRILLERDEYPHWLAVEPAGNRIAITGLGALLTRLRFAAIDRTTGALTLDSRSIDFNRSWPDGWTGAAIPHGAVFSNE